jgi:hypothetical protein
VAGTAGPRPRNRRGAVGPSATHAPPRCGRKSRTGAAPVAGLCPGPCAAAERAGGAGGIDIPCETRSHPSPRWTATVGPAHLAQRALLPQRLLHDAAGCGRDSGVPGRAGARGGLSCAGLLARRLVLALDLPGAGEEDEAPVLGRADGLQEREPLLALDEAQGGALLLDVEEELADAGLLRFDAGLC